MFTQFQAYLPQSNAEASHFRSISCATITYIHQSYMICFLIYTSVYYQNINIQEK